MAFDAAVGALRWLKIPTALPFVTTIDLKDGTCASPCPLSGRQLEAGPFGQLFAFASDSAGSFLCECIPACGAVCLSRLNLAYVRLAGRLARRVLCVPGHAAGLRCCCAIVQTATA